MRAKRTKQINRILAVNHNFSKGVHRHARKTYNKLNSKGRKYFIENLEMSIEELAAIFERSKMKD